MFVGLLELLIEVNEKNKLAIQSSSEIFEALQFDEFSKLNQLNSNLVNLSEEVNLAKERLTKYVLQCCEEKGIKEKRIQFLTENFNIEQKERILSLQKDLIKNDITLKENIFRNQEYLKAMMSYRQMLRDAVIKVNKKDKKGGSGSIFLNERF